MLLLAKQKTYCNMEGKSKLLVSVHARSTFSANSSDQLLLARSCHKSLPLYSTEFSYITYKDPVIVFFDEGEISFQHL